MQTQVWRLCAHCQGVAVAVHKEDTSHTQRFARISHLDWHHEQHCDNEYVAHAHERSGIKLRLVSAHQPPIDT